LAARQIKKNAANDKFNEVASLAANTLFAMSKITGVYKMKAKLLNVLILIALAVGVLTPTHSARAATIDVESTADGPANPAHCPGAACTLRDAVAKANSGDTIRFNLTDSPAEIILTNGEIYIDKDLTIQGPGPADLTISGNNSSRIFYAQSNSSQDIFSISGLTILNGRANNASGGAIFSNMNLTINNVILTQNAIFITDPAYRYQFGGAIYQAFGSLIITNSQITENYASYEGGGLYVRDADLTMSNVSITSNYTDLSYFSSGAGLYIAKLDPNIPDPVTVNLDHVNILNNTTYSGGGGIYAQSLVNLNLSNSTIQGNETIHYSGGGINTADLNATVTINNSNISGNFANGTSGAGGGLYSASQLVVNNSTISDNSASGNGGGIYQQASSITLDGVTLDGNQAEKSGGAIYLGNDSSLDIANSTITNNQSQLSGGGIFSFNSGITTIIKTTTISNNHSISQNGGGVFLGGQVDIENSTISGNSSYLDGGGLLIYASTGGSIINSTISGNTSTTGIAPAYINSNSGNFTLNHVTIAGNNSTNNIGGLSVGDNVFLKNSILADNISGGSYASTDPDCSGTINSQDYNLIESSGDCTLTGTTTHNIIGQDPKLDMLKNNGGSTLTLSLLPGSPAIDPAGNTSCLTEDQRGSLRPQDGDNNGTATCDIGAVEVNGPLAVQSVTRHDANPTSASSVQFIVKFTEPVNGVDKTAPFLDFELSPLGLSGTSITSVTGSGMEFTVTVSTGTGNGSIGLDILDNDSITSIASGNPLGGTGTSNGDYFNGERYTVDRTPPQVSSITRASTNPTSASSVNFTVTFSETVQNVEVSDFTLTTVSSITGASVSNVSGSGSTYTVNINTGTGTGTLRLDIPNTASIQDLGNNALGNIPFTTGEAYTKVSSTTFKSTATNDGWILESSETSNTGGTMNSAATTITLGDDATDKQYRAILHFDTSSLPDTAVVTNMTLKIKQQGAVTGVSPFTFGSLYVDMCNPAFGNSILELVDFSFAAKKVKPAVFNPNPVSGWFSARFNTGGKLYVNRTGTTQLRLYFSVDDNNNNIADFMRFYSGNAAAGNRPKLLISYYLP
jgi:predicted outer membrane repeat protein